MTDVDLERRLRRALTARAAGVTAQDLRPVGSEHRRMKWWLPLSAGLAAAAVLMLIFVVLHRPAGDERPIAPAGSGPAPSQAGDERTSDGSTSDGSTSDGRTSDGRTSDGSTSDGRTRAEPTSSASASAIPSPGVLTDQPNLSPTAMASR
jgi:hypothetical protein